MENTMKTLRTPTWPHQVNLPKDQASMSDVDWIRFIERHIRGIERADALDGARLADTRRALLRHRRAHHARAGKSCPRWTGRLR